MIFGKEFSIIIVRICTVVYCFVLYLYIGIHTHRLSIMIVNQTLDEGPVSDEGPKICEYI